MGTSLWCWVTLGQHLLATLLTKISTNMKTTNVFEDVEFFGMSSYDKYFFGIWKYGSSAFKRTINHVSTTSSYLSTLWNICARKSSKSVVFRRIRASTWLPASYIYEAGSQVGICENQWTSLFEDFGTHMFQSVEKYLDVVGTWLIVR